MDAAGLLLPLHVQPKQQPGSRPEPDVNFFISSIYFQVHKYTPFSEIPAYALNKSYAIQIFLRKI